MRVEMDCLILAAVVGAIGCADVTPPELQTPSDRLGVWTPDPSATILRTTLSNLDNPTLALVSSSTAWDALWAQTWGGTQASPPLPAIDFVLSSVVVVGLGKRAGPGYSVSIDSIVIHIAGAVLYATELGPGAHCDASSGSSAPVHMVHAPGHPPISNWRIGTVRRDCGSATPPG